MNRLQHRERRFTQLLLLIFDGVALFVAFFLALSVRFPHLSHVDLLKIFERDRFFVIYFLLVFSFYLFDLYEPRHWRTKIYSPLRLVLGTVLCALLSFATFYFFTERVRGMFGRGVFLGAIILFIPLALFIRYLVEKRQKSKLKKQSWLFIGEQRSYDLLQDEIKRVGFGANLEFLSNTIPTEELLPILNRSWTGIVVGLKPPAELTKRLMKLRLGGLPILSLQNFYEFYFGKIPLHSLDDAWFAYAEGFAILHSPMSVRLKRATDILLSLLLMIPFFPVAWIVALFVRLESRGAAFFKQKRMGIDGHVFTMWKIRSMRQDAEKNGAQWAAANDGRVTRIGRIIRKMRLDEIPQLWNILIGDMSFVGPRPERPEFTRQLAEKIPFYEFRHLIKPGLTGWAQVMFPYGASEDDAREKLQYELFYIKNFSFDLDLEIVFRTVTVVLFGAGR